MAQNSRIIKLEKPEFTPAQRTTIEELLMDPMMIQQLLHVMESNSFQNFLFMGLPMLRTQKQQKTISKGFKSIGLSILGSLTFSTACSIMSTPYIIRKPAYVRYPIRMLLFTIPITLAFFKFTQPALDSLVLTHIGIQKRIDSFLRYGKPKDFFGK